ncbi:hypothetical protein NPIL_280801 [Nephila pilipes]|uniref:Uncharacterized protein n=1 Tax=Nephila pilipes TaxID=299642 RepID=A0A8X6KG77_NEPPI|nr:hypothetical protein NPIL_280801 [Nephila pilipes]
MKVRRSSEIRLWNSSCGCPPANHITAFLKNHQSARASPWAQLQLKNGALFQSGEVKAYLCATNCRVCDFGFHFHHLNTPRRCFTTFQEHIPPTTLLFGLGGKTKGSITSSSL